MNLAWKLKELREEKKLTQEAFLKELEAKTGRKLSISAYRNYENDIKIRIPKNDILYDVAKFYGVSLNYLLNDENDDNKTDENIKIGNILGLSDEAIENLKKIKENNNKTIQALDISEVENDFLSRNNLVYLFQMLSVLKKISSYKQMFYGFVYDKEKLTFEIIDEKLKEISEYLLSNIDTSPKYKEFEEIKEQINKYKMNKNESALSEADLIFVKYMTELLMDWEKLKEMHEFRIEKYIRNYIERIKNYDEVKDINELGFLD